MKGLQGKKDRVGLVNTKCTGRVDSKIPVHLLSWLVLVCPGRIRKSEQLPLMLDAAASHLDREHLTLHSDLYNDRNLLLDAWSTFFTASSFIQTVGTLTAKNSPIYCFG